VTYILGSTVSF